MNQVRYVYLYVCEATFSRPFPCESGEICVGEATFSRPSPSESGEICVGEATFYRYSS